MVRIRLKRMGRRHVPVFRIVVMDQRSPRDGRTIEEIGTYDPRQTDEAKKVVLNRERAAHWLDHGAQPSESVGALLKKSGIHSA